MKITRVATASLLGVLSLGSGACSLSSARWRMATYEVTAQVPESLTTGKPSTGPAAEEHRREMAMGGNLEPRARRSAGGGGAILAANAQGDLPPLPLEFTTPELVDIPKPDELTGMPRRQGSPELLMIPLHQDTDADPDLPNSGPSGDTGAPGLLPPMYDDAAAGGAPAPVLTDADVTPPEMTPVAPAAASVENIPGTESCSQPLVPQEGPPAPEGESAEPAPAQDAEPAAEHDAMESLLSVLRPRQVTSPAAPVAGLASRGPLRPARTP